MLLDFAGQRLLTDPWFSERRGYYHGEQLAFTPDGLPELAGVLVSHGHYDHFDMAVFAAYPDRSVPFVVKRGLAARVRQAGFTNVTEVDAWEQPALGQLRVTAAPARHSVPEVSFVIEGGGQSVFFGGDTLRIAELDQVARRFPPVDLALLPVNGLAIRPAFNRQIVMTAEEAAGLVGVLRAQVAVPIHYRYTAGPLRGRLLLKYDGTPERFTAALTSAAPTTQPRILEPGEPLVVNGTAAAQRQIQDRTQDDHTGIGYGLSGLAGARIVVIGARFLLAPRTTAAAFGVRVGPEPGPAGACLAARGARDTRRGCSRPSPSPPGHSICSAGSCSPPSIREIAVHLGLDSGQAGPAARRTAHQTPRDLDLRLPGRRRGRSILARQPRRPAPRRI